MGYVKVWINLNWSTRNRLPLMTDEVRQRILDHISGNAVKKNIYLDCINAVSDHVHALISLGVDQTISKTVQLLKGESSYWANKEGITRTKFEWQDEYFADSVSETMLETVRNYIRDQEEHHRKKTFKEEYEGFLKQSGYPTYLGGTRI